MKRYIGSSQKKQSMEYYKDVPSKINKKFIQRKVEAAFISSILSNRYKKTDLAIIANKKVLSVIAINNTDAKDDAESATSNILAKILGINNQILIGDKALKYALGSNDYTDLAYEWYKKYKLPFVFATFCYHSNKQYYEKLQKNFLKHNKKIPQYILKKKSKELGISASDINYYLSLISYIQTHKSKKALRKFLSKAKLKLKSNRIIT